jgi:ADP-ribose pyrophosphatase
MSSSLLQTVVIRVDLDTHGKVVQKLEEGEFIDTHMVDVKGILAVLRDFNEKGYLIDGKVWEWAAGLELAQEL